MKKIFFSLLAVAAALLIVLGADLYAEKSSAENISASASVPSSVEPAATPLPTPELLQLSFSATGDNLIHNGIYEQAHRRAAAKGESGYDFSYCFENVKQFYQSFDINWLNQETLVNDELEPSTYPCFSTPGEMGKAAYDTGFRIFSLSNNHTYDKGAKGIEATQKFWSGMPQDVITCGLYDIENPAITYQEIHGLKIAYLSFTEHTNGLPHPNNAKAHVIYTSETDKIESLTTEASDKADLVIVSVHWGIEGSHGITEIQRTLAQDIANWGADVIIGTGPHVVQDAEWIMRDNGTPCFVAYSLGNFLNAQSNADCMIGAILTFQIVARDLSTGNAQIMIEAPKLIPVINHYDKNYSNIRVYLRSDYTDELASKHGINAEMPGFSLEYIDRILTKTVNAEFLKL